MSGVGKIVRALIGLVVLVALIYVVNSWYQQYKHASTTTRSSKQSVVASGSVSTTQVVPVSGGQRVSILTDGVVLRITPATSAAMIRSLKKGEQLLLVGTSGSWLQVRDSKNGRLGYVANKSTDVQVVK